MDKKLWTIYWCSENTDIDGWVSIDYKEIATVRATEEEIKKLIETDWNPFSLVDTYGVKYRELMAEEKIPIDIADFIETERFQNIKGTIIRFNTENGSEQSEESTTKVGFSHNEESADKLIF